MEEKKAKMLKFIMGKGHQHSAERLKVQKELFKFSRVSFRDFLCFVNNANALVNFNFWQLLFTETNCYVKELYVFI